MLFKFLIFSCFLAFVTAKLQYLFMQFTDNKMIEIDDEFVDIFELDDEINEPQFCENLGYSISSEMYTYDYAFIACEEIGKDLVIVTDDNIYDVTSALDACVGKGADAWINDYYGNYDDECVLLHTGFEYSCNFSENICDQEHIVVCE